MTKPVVETPPAETREVTLSGRTITPWLRLETRKTPAGEVVNVAMVIAGNSARQTHNIVLSARHVLQETKETYTRLEIVARPEVLAALAKAQEKRARKAARWSSV